MSATRNELDYKNLQEFDINKAKRFVEITNTNSNPVNTGGLLSGVSYDSFQIQYTSPTVETYLFYSGGLSGTLKATIILTYTNSSKNDLSTAVRT